MLHLLKHKRITINVATYSLIVCLRDLCMLHVTVILYDACTLYNIILK